MGLESYNLKYIAPETAIILWQKELERFNAIPSIKKSSHFHYYKIEQNGYLIDLQSDNRSLEIKIALCNPVCSMEFSLKLVTELIHKFKGTVTSLKSKIKSTNMQPEDRDNFLSDFDEQKTLFIENIADFEAPLSSDDVFKYIRDNDVKPRKTD